MTRMELLIQGDFLGLITAELFVAASYSYTFAGAQFYVKVTVDLSGINSVRKVQYFVGYRPPPPPPRSIMLRSLCPILFFMLVGVLASLDKEAFCDKNILKLCGTLESISFWPFRFTPFRHVRHTFCPTPFQNTFSKCYIPLLFVLISFYFLSVSTRAVIDQFCGPYSTVRLSKI